MSSFSQRPVNYFSNAEAAARYRKARPYYHAQAVERICAQLGVEKLRRVLDVGCGAGQSTIALAEVADEVVAVDASAEMLAEAPVRDNVVYQCGVAEGLEFEEGEFDLISVGSALHWFDQAKFFAEARRVLRADGALVVYNDHFTTHMRERPEMSQWMRSRFAKRFRRPRGMRDIDETKATDAGFAIVARESLERVERFRREQFIDFLLTRTNTLRAIEQGRETAKSAAEWMNEELREMIAEGERAELVFKCNLWVMKKQG